MQYSIVVTAISFVFLVSVLFQVHLGIRLAKKISDLYGIKGIYFIFLRYSIAFLSIIPGLVPFLWRRFRDKEQEKGGDKSF